MRKSSKFIKLRATYPISFELQTVLTEHFLSSVPKPTKQTRRPRPKPKTAPTPEAPQTKPGKCGFLVTGVFSEDLGKLLARPILEAMWGGGTVQSTAAPAAVGKSVGVLSGS